MPNGDVPGGTGVIGPIVSLVTSTLGRFFGGGGHDPGEHLSSLPSIQISNEIQRVVEGFSGTRITQSLIETGQFPDIAALRVEQGRDPITGRFPILTPAQGGPPLVTERFADLPGPFVREPALPILQELGIPFPEPEAFLPRARGLPEPDVLEEDMAIDVPLLSGFGGLLPAVRGVAAPTVSGFIGGLAQDVLSGLFARAPQELGVGQVPMRRAQAAIAERPSTRILRQILNATGVRVKLSSAKALVRQLGLQNGARCLGISITDACTLIITPSPRRRRGISGSDIRIVKRTARRFQSLQEDLSGLVSRRRAAPRRKARHVHAIAHTAPAAS